MVFSPRRPPTSKAGKLSSSANTRAGPSTAEEVRGRSSLHGPPKFPRDLRALTSFRKPAFQESQSDQNPLEIPSRRFSPFSTLSPGQTGEGGGR